MKLDCKTNIMHWFYIIQRLAFQNRTTYVIIMKIFAHHILILNLLLCNGCFWLVTHALLNCFSMVFYLCQVIRVLIHTEKSCDSYNYSSAKIVMDIHCYFFYISVSNASSNRIDVCMKRIDIKWCIKCLWCETWYMFFKNQHLSKQCIRYYLPLYSHTNQIRKELEASENIFLEKKS